MPPDNFNRLYVQRTIDSTLWDKVCPWLGTDPPVRWLSLHSRPGQGNSWLLQRFQQLASKHLGFNDMKMVFVADTATHDRPPTTLNPLAAELHRMYATGRMSHLRRLRLRLKHASPWQIAATSLIIVACFIMTCLLAGLSEYTTTIDTDPIHIERWLPKFWTEFLPRHWLTFPLWFLSGSLVGVPLSLAFLYMARNRLLPRPTPEKISDDVLADFQTPETLTDVLTYICRNRRGLLLVIDDAHDLPDDAKLFLVRIFNPQPADATLQRFRNTHRILIITLESREVNWQSRVADNVQTSVETLEVPAFTAVELHEIADIQLTESDGVHSDDEVERLLAETHSNVKAMFAHRDSALVDSMGEKFLAAEAESIKAVFDLADVMAYQIVGQGDCITKSELLSWLESEKVTQHLTVFGLRRPSDLQQLVKNFSSKSSLVRVEGDICYFDMQRCRALRNWLKTHSPQLLARAHYFWFGSWRSEVANLDITPSKVSTLSAAHRQAIKRAAWHVSAISILLQRPHQVLTSAPGLTDDQRRQRRDEAAATLLAAAALWRSEGDISEADDLIHDAIEWLEGARDLPGRALLEVAAGQLWQDYWLTSDSTCRRQIDSLAEQFGELQNTPTWKVNRQLEEEFQGSERLFVAVSGLSDPIGQNLGNLAENLWLLRQSQGFRELAFQDVGMRLREAVVAMGETIVEPELRYLQCTALNRRSDIQGVSHALGQWRARLQVAAPSGTHIGDEALHAYNVARYWHLIADTWKVGTASLKDRPVAERTELEEDLRNLVQDACLTPTPSPGDLPVHIFQEARLAYESSLEIANLLGWQVLMLEASFNLGVLLYSYTPKEEQTETPPWWQRWDGLFNVCLQLEQESGWILHTPSIHRLRWKFFEDLDHQSSIEDAYNSLQSAKRVHYPIKVILGLHQQVSGMLNDYGDSTGDRERSAELQLMWAQELAALPEAAELRRFKCLQHEQAWALTFAAQAMRLMQDGARAAQLLDEAEVFLQQAPALPSEDGESAEKLRDLRISLNLQRAWVQELQGRKEEHRELIREIWRQLRRSDRDCANLIHSLLRIERQEKLLQEPWPVMEDALVYEDPDSPNFSLPAGWFEKGDALQIKNRFEFRFYQLLSLVSFDEIPTRWSLELSALSGWQGVNRFAQVALGFAELGLGCKLTNSAKEQMLDLLAMVRLYFAEVNEIDRDELEALRLLIHFQPDSMEYRVEYVKVLCEFKYLLERELRVREAAGGLNWCAMARRLNSYLGILVNRTLLTARLAGRLGHSSLSLERVMELHRQQEELLQQAREDYRKGDHAECLQKLRSVFPSESSPWVFFEDLEVLDLWLECVRESSELRPEELGRGAAQLRGLALRFIQQFSETIREEEVQHLVLELLRSLQHTVEAMPPLRRLRGGALADTQQ